ncbi:MAG TPA: nitrate/nitrite transporter [Candidatus Paceibacterota bacterium]|nr:nitrate/nitrite transporter [Verrucomicrobiota bacterium]HRY47506.1 nitrate/nitrite transporter [Candidatus Paceibacterota bacterium]HSA03181.1 nitrate/nitrite transporter [Candidatus Paceibacterota bacterium]
MNISSSERSAQILAQTATAFESAGSHSQAAEHCQKQGVTDIPRRQRNTILTLSTAAFTLMFAVWLMFGVLGIPIRKEFGLTDVQFGWLTAIAILNGSIWRLLFGLWTDRFGGHKVLTLLVGLTAIPSFLVSRASTFNELLFYAFLVGMAGNAFSVGIAWNSAWFPRDRQGFALGVFGAGNVGASVTKFIGPALIAIVPAAGYWGGWMPGGWRFVPFLYGIFCLLMAAGLWFLCPSEDRKPGAGRPLAELLRPLKQVRVWRFSLYYVIVFGAYVALSVWLPKYYVDVFGISLPKAALLTALFIFPASLLRPLGGWLSDKYGARRIMYWVFGTMLLALLVLSAPQGHIVLYVPENIHPGGRMETMRFVMGPTLFTLLVFMVGCGMGIGKAAVYKYIPEYFPRDVGAVGGLVGLLGALGGFYLPPLFAYAYKATGIPQTTFAILFLITLLSFAWLHWVVYRLMRQATPHLQNQFEVKR